MFISICRKIRFHLLILALLIWPTFAWSQSVRKVYTGGTTPPTYPLTATGMQNAINDAQPGEIIYVQNDADLSGTFILRQKSCAAGNDTCYITISGGIDSSGNLAGTYPAANVRIGPAYAASLPNFKPAANNTPAFRTVYPAETGNGCSTPTCLGNYWKLTRIEVTNFAPWNASSLIIFGTNSAASDLPGNDNQDRSVEIPHHLILDQVYVHGDPVRGQNRCMTNAAKNTFVLNSYFGNCMSQLETQAISVVNTTGPQTYTNNYMEGSGETFMTGGSDPYGRFSATVLASPAPTTTSARLSVCAELGTTANHQWFTIEDGGTEYFRKIDTINTTTCDITWTDPLPSTPDQPGDSDAVNWSWTFGGLDFEKNYVTKNVNWRNPIVASPTSVSATPSATGGTMTAGTNFYRIVAKLQTTNSNIAQSTWTTETSAVTTGSTASVALSWTPPANVDSYEIHWRVGSASRVITLAAPASGYTQTSPTAGTAENATPQNPTISAVAGGSLAVGTYQFRVTSYPYNNAPTAELVCTTTSTNKTCNISWDAVTGATGYRVWGWQSTGGGPNQTHYMCVPGACGLGYSTVSTSFSVTSNASGNYVSSDLFDITAGSVWIVKNTFELKNCDGLSDAGPCVVKFNVFENSWLQAQTGMVVNVKNNNQDFNDDSAVFRNTEISNNIIRHGTRAIQTCSFDCDGHGSGVSEGIHFRNNLMYDINSTWGINQAAIFMGAGTNAGAPSQRGGTDYEFSHNTLLIDASGYGPMYLTGATSSLLWPDLKWTNNLTYRGLNGFHGEWNGSFGSGGEGDVPWNQETTGAGRQSANNVFADATAGSYTAFTGSFFPTAATMQGWFSNYANCIAGTLSGCTITSGSADNGATDGTDIGVNMTTMTAGTDIAISGDNSGGGGGGGGTVPSFVSQASGGNPNASTVTTTTSLTISGSNRYVVCGVAFQVLSQTGTSVTIDSTGQTLTKQTTKDFDNSGLQARIEYWDLVNPTATTGTVTVVLSGSTAVALGCVAYQDVDQTTPHDTLVTAGASSNTVSVTVPSAATDLVIDFASIRVGTTGMTEGAGQTNRIEKQSGSGAGNVTLVSSTEAGSASTVMSWTVDDSTSKSWATIGASLNPVDGGGPPPATLDITSASPLEPGIVGTAYSTTLTATGGTPPYTWTRTSGTMPAGMSLNSSTGVFSGTPTTVGGSTLQFTVTDSASAKDAKTFTWTRLPQRPNSIYGGDALVFATCDEPGIANNRIVRAGDFWNNTCTNTVSMRATDGSWTTLGGVSAVALSELSDVSITAPTDQQALRYDITSSKWKNVNFSGIANGGNAFGVPVIIGATDAQPAQLIANGTVRLKTDAGSGINAVALQANGDNNPELYISQNDTADWMSMGFSTSDGRRVVGQAGSGTFRSYFGLAGATTGTDFIWGVASSSNSGSTITRYLGVRSDGMVTVKHLSLQTGAKPTCAAAERGTLWYVAGGAGVKDTVEVCAKDASDVYAWRAIY